MVDPKKTWQQEAQSWHTALLEDVAAALADICKLSQKSQLRSTRETRDGLLEELHKSLSQYVLTSAKLLLGIACMMVDECCK
jgi:hypothetical protein